MITRDILTRLPNNELSTREAPRRSRAEDLERIMVRYQRADSRAADELVGLLTARLLKYFSTSSLTRPHAEDLLQEFWIRLHKTRHNYRPGAPVLPWIYAIARYTLLDGRRRLRRHGWHDNIDTEAVPGEAGRDVDLAVDMERMISRLPVSQQRAFVMLKVSGLSLTEVAQATGSSVGAVKQKAHRAYVRLRSILHDDGYRGGRRGVDRRRPPALQGLGAGL